MPRTVRVSLGSISPSSRTRPVEKRASSSCRICPSIAARLRPTDVEDYLDTHGEEWGSLAEADPHDAADILEELGEDAATDLITGLDPPEAADVLEEMRDDLAADILEGLDPGQAASLIARMPADEAADLVAELEISARREILGALDTPTADEVISLLEWPADSAGGLMTKKYAALPHGLTTGEAIERIRQLHERLENLSYVYVTDDNGVLEGVISFRDLVFARPGVGLDQVMVPNPVRITPDTDREQIAGLAERYNLFGLPVVDRHTHLIGVVATDAVIESVRAEASEDFAVASGAGAEETVYTDVVSSVRMRAPWLVVNLGLALIVAVVIERQLGVISSEPVLAALMPVVALLGGNGGSQSLAVVIRGLATADVPATEVRSVLGRQLRIGLLNGLIVALLGAGLATLLIEVGVFSSGSAGWLVGIVVGIAALANLTIATTAGTGIPLLLRSAGLDPALASSIFLTLVTDVVGFGGFLLVAAALL